LRVLPADARVVVAELIPEVIAWNRNPDYALAGGALEDPRVEVRQADVTGLLRAGAASYDAIMLDVDNGAEVFTDSGNAALYHAAGVRLAAAALRSGGRLAYWSADEDPAFAGVMRAAGLDVVAERARAYATGGAWHWIIVGTRKG
jgi:spermidine synthase